MNRSRAMAPQPDAPWYRHRWPWLLAIAPAVALVGGVVTFWLAARTGDPMVVDDYYREGRAINQQLARDRQATALGLHATVRLHANAAGTARVEVTLAAERGSGWPERLELRIVHATRSELDAAYALRGAGDGHYRGSGALPPAGRWLVQLEDPGRTWRLVDPLVTRFDVPIELRAAAP